MSVHALRFYEREDLLIGPIERTSGGRRRYREVDIDWLRICTRLRESGMPLADLRRFAALVREGSATKPNGWRFSRDSDAGSTGRSTPCGMPATSSTGRPTCTGSTCAPETQSVSGTPPLEFLRPRRVR
ncbi:MerR family transcriptional regulator [Gordonia polyisoprenivorans]|nr:MerR family transcriptional regulator [Gordonia polyisoprenivorans]WCB40217.1 MerR family transcriptional regulator [Gordonia polyisoprenivorans]